jgi:hypothetical protein
MFLLFPCVIYNIYIYIERERDMRCKGVDRIHLTLDRDHGRAFVNTVINLWVTRKAGNCLINWATVSFSSTSCSYIFYSTFIIIIFSSYHHFSNHIFCEIWGFHGGENSRSSSGWRWTRHGSLKRWYPTRTLHGVTIQKASTWTIFSKSGLARSRIYKNSNAIYN